MRVRSTVAVLGAFVASVSAQGGFQDTGLAISAQFKKHARYHALLVMASYGDPAVTCPLTFTPQTLQRNYPGSKEEPFVIVDKWGPTPKYGMSGYSVKVAEMNKIVMVFSDVVGWENFNATLAPFLGVGCDKTCMAHQGALEAFKEIQAATNDWAAIKANQGSHVWSTSGHGFGGAVGMVAAMDLKHRGFAYSVMTFGAPPVFNAAAADKFSQLFSEQDETAAQRLVANNDATPGKLSLNNSASYQPTGMGVHVYGSGNAMYGQNYDLCYDQFDPNCWGGKNEADHWFYFTQAGQCGAHDNSTYSPAWVNQYYAARMASFAQTATASIGMPVTTAIANTSTALPTTTSSSALNTTAVITDPGAAGPSDTAAVPGNVSAGSSAGRTAVLVPTTITASLALASWLLL